MLELTVPVSQHSTQHNCSISIHCSVSRTHTGISIYSQLHTCLPLTLLLASIPDTEYIEHYKPCCWGLFQTQSTCTSETFLLLTSMENTRCSQDRVHCPSCDLENTQHKIATVAEADEILYQTMFPRISEFLMNNFHVRVN